MSANFQSFIDSVGSRLGSLTAKAPGAASPFSGSFRVPSPFGGALQVGSPFQNTQLVGTSPFNQPGGVSSPFTGQNAVSSPFGGGFTVGSPFGGQFNVGSPFGGVNGGVASPFGGGSPFNIQNPQSIENAQNPPKPATSNGDYPNAGGGSGSGATGLDGVWAKIDQYSDLIDKYAGEAGIDGDVFRAIMYNESGGNPNAHEPNLGASGLLQLMPQEWQPEGANPFDPETNLRLGARLMKQKVAGVRAAYAKNGIVADERTFARDLALAWAGHFDYGTGRPNGSSRDAVFGQTADQLSNVFLGHYDELKGQRAKQPKVGGGAGDGSLGSLGPQVAAKAQSVLGIPYTHGGIRNTGRPQDGMDCSSFTGWLLGMDRNLWNAQVQYDNTTRVNVQQAQAGDLVFFQGTTNNDPSARPVTHVGVLLGSGKMIHTGGDGGVMIVDLNTQYWQSHLYGYGRKR